MVKNLNGKQIKTSGKTNGIRIRKLITPAKLQAALLRQESIPILTTRDIRRILNVSPRRTQRALQDAMKEEVLMRVKPGLYALVVRPPAAFVAANYLMEPSYISFESALSYHRIIPETVYSITSVTPKYPARFTRLNREFTYHKINRKLYFGYSKILVGGAPVLMAEKEKAVLDYLYFVVQGLRKINHRSNFSKLDTERLKTYALTFRTVLKGRKRVAFNNLLETLELV